MTGSCCERDILVLAEYLEVTVRDKAVEEHQPAHDRPVLRRIDHSDEGLVKKLRHKRPVVPGSPLPEVERRYRLRDLIYVVLVHAFSDGPLFGR